jgi:hypothetical protein
MVTERKENIEPANPFIPGIEIALGHRESMPKVQQSVHVRIRKSLEELRVLIGLSYKILMSLPNISGSLFK